MVGLSQLPSPILCSLIDDQGQRSYPELAGQHPMTSEIKTSCRYCGCEFNIPEVDATREVQCPECAATFRIDASGNRTFHVEGKKADEVKSVASAIFERVARKDADSPEPKDKEKGSGLLPALGKIAGVGGIALGVYVILFQDFIRQRFFPEHFPVTEGYNLLLLFMFFTFGIAIAGLSVWANGIPSGRNLPFILLAFALVMCGLGAWLITRQKADAVAKVAEDSQPPQVIHEEPSSANSGIGVSKSNLRAKRDAADSSLQVPSVDLISTSVQFLGDTTVDFDNADTAFEKKYKVSFALRNVGVTAAVDTRYSLSCDAYHWGETAPTENIPQFRSDHIATLAPGWGENVDVRADKPMLTSGRSQQPTAMRCFVTLRYQDVSHHPHGGQFCVETPDIPKDQGSSSDLGICGPGRVKLRRPF